GTAAEALVLGLDERRGDGRPGRGGPRASSSSWTAPHSRSTWLAMSRTGARPGPLSARPASRSAQLLLYLVVRWRFLGEQGEAQGAHLWGTFSCFIGAAITSSAVRPFGSGPTRPTRPFSPRAKRLRPSRTGCGTSARP